MPPRVRVVSSGGGPGPGITLGAVLAVIAALVVGLIIGRATAPNDRSAATHDGAGAPAAGPTRTNNGVPVRYAHTEQGAVAALLNYSVVLGNPEVLLNAGRRSQVLAVVATPRYAQTFKGAGAAALQAARSGPIGAGLQGSAQTIYLASPIAYRVQSYTPAAAVVQGWGVSVIGNDQGLAPQATWGSTVTTARWMNGDWKIDAVSSTAGPTPALAAAQQPSSASEFLSRLAGLQEPHHAP
jgi:hypothetical protein